MTITFELVDSKPSGYVMDGPGVNLEDADQTPQISFPSLRKIRNTSRVKVEIPAENGREATYTFKKIRYIAGCPFIDVETQEAQGFKPNPLADMIVFKYGNKTATREGDIALYDYLNACEYNIAAPNRPDDAEDVFKPLQPLLDAQGEETIIDQQNQCMNIIQGLKVKKDAGGFRYNEDALEFYCSLFKIPAFPSGYNSEAWVALANFANDQPDVFLNSIASARSVIEADVFAAITFGVITIDQQRAFVTDGGALVTEFETGLNADQKGQALVDFMSNPKNRNHYDNMRVLVKNAKTAKLDIVQ